MDGLLWGALNVDVDVIVLVCVSKGRLVGVPGFGIFGERVAWKVVSAVSPSALVLPPCVCVCNIDMAPLERRVANTVVEIRKESLDESLSMCKKTCGRKRLWLEQHPVATGTC